MEKTLVLYVPAIRIPFAALYLNNRQHSLGIITLNKQNVSGCSTSPSMLNTITPNRLVLENQPHSPCSLRGRRYDDPCPSLLWFFPPITFSFTLPTKRFVRRVARFVDSYSSSNFRFDIPIEPRSKDLIFNIVLWWKIIVSPPHVAISIAFHSAFNEILVSTLSGIIPCANNHVRV